MEETMTLSKKKPHPKISNSIWTQFCQNNYQKNVFIQRMMLETSNASIQIMKMMMKIMTTSSDSTKEEIQPPNFHDKPMGYYQP